MQKLHGTLVFVQVNQPVDCFDKAKGKEWKASIVVDEDQADNWNEEYNKQPALAVKTTEFKDKYKIDPPVPGAKKQYVITLRKNTILGNGNPVPDQYQPKVLKKNASGTFDDLTQTTLVANGSTGWISVDTWEHSKGKTARLKNILVENLIVYEKAEGSGSYAPGSEFGDEPAATPKADKPAAKPKAKTNDEDPF